jgi:hypothetical protein
MRINEIVSPKSNALTEGMMKYPEWRKDKYANPFIDRIIDKEEDPVNFARDGEEFTGIVRSTKENIKMARYLQSVLASGGEANLLATIKFDVELLDDDDNPTGQMEQVKLQEIAKDELMTGELRVNLGNIAELVLGCAVTAKYEKQKAEVEFSDVVDVAIRLAKGNGLVTAEAGKDTLSFSASVPSADKKAFAAYVGEDPKGRTLKDFGIKPAVTKGIEQHIKSAVTYVNTSPRVLMAVDKAAADPNKNEVEIKSDGGNAENQKTTKVDLKIMINPGPDGQPLRLNLLSIKAGNVGQFGQVSGYEFEKLNNFFQDSLGISLSGGADPKTGNPKKGTVEAAFGKFDTNLKGKERTTNREEVREINYTSGFTKAYDEVEKTLTRIAKTDQLGLIQQVYDGMLYHATRKEEGVEMVILSPNAKQAFAELTFGPELKSALDDYNLQVHRGSSEKMHIIQIYGYPKTTKVKKAMGSSKELLVQYRSYSQKKAVRNIIEMGNLLKELADWQKIEARKAGKPSPAPVPNTAPVVTTQATAPTPTELPSRMTPIAPAATTIQSPERDETAPESDEIDRIRKNAGITV